MELGLLIFGYLGTAVFAISGAMLGLKKEMDIVGVSFLATLTGIGGGTVRDVLLGATPVGWVTNPTDLIICLVTSFILCLLNRWLDGRRMTWLLYADAAGLSLFAVSGTAKALALEAHPLVAILFGAMSASFGGIVRDVVAGEVPVVFHKDIYISAALLGGAIYVVLPESVPFEFRATGAMLSAFILRVLAMKKGWHLGFPRYPSK